MTYTQPPAKTAGDPTLATDWNVYVKDNLIHLRALVPDAGSSNLPLVSSSTTTATFAKVGTAGIENNAITLEKIAASARAPIGAIQMYAGASPPSGWLLCQGQAVSRTVNYADLFAVLGTAYGAGDGSTTFNLPNLQAKFPIGVDTAPSTTYTRGATGGATSHVHGLNNHTHGLNGHTHTYSSQAGFIVIGDPTTKVTAGSGGTKAGGEFHGHEISWTGMTTDGSSASSAASSGNTASTSEMPPYVVVNYIIYTGYLA